MVLILVLTCVITMTSAVDALLNCPANFTANTDPCSSAPDLIMDHRVYNNTENVGNCDKILVPGWYKLTVNGEPAEIPSVCIKNQHCGTRLPMRLNLPDGPPPVNVTTCVEACTSYEVLGIWDCCVLRQWVSIRNCGDYFVYYLIPTDRCPVAYCAQGRNVMPGQEITAKTGENVSSEDRYVTSTPSTAVTMTTSTTLGASQSTCEDDPVPCPRGNNRTCCSDASNRTMVECIEPTGRYGYLCDQVPDCDDHSDEAGDICTSVSCSEGQLVCPDGSNCANRCDGTRDCNDGSDENGCPQTVTTSDLDFTLDVTAYSNSQERVQNGSFNDDLATAMTDILNDMTPEPENNSVLIRHARSLTGNQSIVVDCSVNSTLDRDALRSVFHNESVVDALLQTLFGHPDPDVLSDTSTMSDPVEMTTLQESTLSGTDGPTDASTLSPGGTSHVTQVITMTQEIPGGTEGNVSVSVESTTETATIPLQTDTPIDPSQTETSSLQTVTEDNQNLTTEASAPSANTTNDIHTQTDINAFQSITTVVPTQSETSSLQTAQTETQTPSVTTHEPTETDTSPLQTVTSDVLTVEDGSTETSSHVSVTTDATTHSVSSSIPSLTSDSPSWETTDSENVTIKQDDLNDTEATTHSFGDSTTAQYTESRTTIFDHTEAFTVHDNQSMSTGITEEYATTSTAHPDTVDQMTSGSTIGVTTHVISTTSGMLPSSDGSVGIDIDASTQSTIISTAEVSTESVTPESVSNVETTVTTEQSDRTTETVPVSETVSSIHSAASTTSYVSGPLRTEASVETTAHTMHVTEADLTTIVTTDSTLVSTTSESTIVEQTVISTGSESARTSEMPVTQSSSGTSVHIQSTEYIVTSVTTEPTTELAQPPTTASHVTTSPAPHIVTSTSRSDVTVSTDDALITATLGSVSSTEDLVSESSSTVTPKAEAPEDSTDITTIADIDNTTAANITTVETDGRGDLATLIEENAGLFIFLIVFACVIFGIFLFGLIGYIYQSRLRTWSPKMAYQDAYSNMEKKVLAGTKSSSGLAHSSPIPDVDMLQDEQETSLSRASTLECPRTPANGSASSNPGDDVPTTTGSDMPAIINVNSSYHDADGVVPIEEIDKLYPTIPWIESAEDTKL